MDNVIDGDTVLCLCTAINMTETAVRVIRDLFLFITDGSYRSNTTTINPCKHTNICIILTFSFYFAEITYINFINTNRLTLFRLIIAVVL